MSTLNGEQPSAQPRLRSALARIQSELAQEQDAELLPLNVDPLDATARARAALPAIMELRPSIEKRLVDFDLHYLDELETYALALIQAHGLYLCAKAPPEDFAKCVTEAAELRERLLLDVSALIQRNHLQYGLKRAHRGPLSYREIAGDVLALSSLLRANWSEIASKCGLSLEELDRAEILGDRLNRLLGARQRAPVVLAEATRQRQRAFTLFARAYSQVRKAVVYLRWESDDADEIAPPLCRGRKATRKKASVNSEAPVATEEQ